MSTYSRSITPDSLTGIVFALEGVARTTVLLNGPTGCKYYHAAMSDNQQIRSSGSNPLDHPMKWYFGQSRVPCTYLDNGDYVYGSEDKLVEALSSMKEHNDSELIAIVNTPGASLIGDDLRGIVASVMPDRLAVTFQTPGFSSDICNGFEYAATTLIEKVADSVAYGQARPRTVNLLGMSFFDRNHEGDVGEIRRLLELCGVQVNTVLCGGGTLDEVRALPAASLNVVVHSEFGLATAQFLQERYGMESYVCAELPIGFAATETMIAGVCAKLGCDAAPALEDSKRARARAYAFVARVNSLTGLPKGVTYACEGSYSELHATISFLSGYLGMIPVAATVQHGLRDEGRSQLMELLRGYGLEDVLNVDVVDADADVVLGSGNTIAELRAANRKCSGIETHLPTLGYFDVIPKTFLGVRGALHLVELVLNGLRY